MLASFRVSERYNSITSGTRRTVFKPIDDFDGVGGGGGAAVGCIFIPFSFLCEGEKRVEAGFGGGVGGKTIDDFSFLGEVDES
ncbi:hypothetical protein MtrunA17_Chr5g0430711 [Medicago truncatula]|uniref:Uncharacterized protein n=1 Tax=Medicago truncatula TaxID=3880 RepID=A0A396HYR7_MEDTR|nr:hypothetical protein MtrunA17_Chr5g0430711 [Medicago truncatula]